MASVAFYSCYLRRSIDGLSSNCGREEIIRISQPVKSYRKNTEITLPIAKRSLYVLKWPADTVDVFVCKLYCTLVIGTTQVDVSGQKHGIRNDEPIAEDLLFVGTKQDMSLDVTNEKCKERRSMEWRVFHL